MSKLVFCPPDGAPIVDPSEATLRAVIAHPVEAYWKAGSGDAGLHFEGPCGASHLVLKFKEGVGFMVYYEADSNDPFLVLSKNPELDEIIELEEGGNSMRVPRSHFVPPEMALDAVLEFTHSGRPMAIGNWIEFAPEEP